MPMVPLLLLFFKILDQLVERLDGGRGVAGVTDHEEALGPDAEGGAARDHPGHALVIIHAGTFARDAGVSHPILAVIGFG